MYDGGHTPSHHCLVSVEGRTNWVSVFLDNYKLPSKKKLHRNKTKHTTRRPTVLVMGRLAAKVGGRGRHNKHPGSIGVQTSNYGSSALDEDNYTKPRLLPHTSTNWGTRYFWCIPIILGYSKTKDSNRCVHPMGLEK